jgi:hypothetical protein
MKTKPSLAGTTCTKTLAGHLRTVCATRLLPLLLLLMLPAAVQAEDYTYTTNNGTITITQYTGSGSAVSIPGSINGLPIASIGWRAFWLRTSLTSITIPNSVTNIEWEAFSECTSLTNVTIPDSVTSIGDGAFFGCTSLTSVTIPKSVTFIGGYSSDGSAFSGCQSLTAITVDALNPTYSSVDGVLFNKDQTTLIRCPEGKAGTYPLPTSVISIGWQAFWRCTGLTSLTIPNSVTNIGWEAFSECTSLTNVTISESVTSIEGGMFSSCTSLASVTIPNSVTSIGGWAHLPGPWWDGAFAGCTSLTNVTIPNSVTSIGDGAFASCTSLKAITVEVLNSAYSSVDGVLLNKSQTTLIQCPGGKTGSYAVPNGVTSIAAFAFAGCTSLTSVTIPNSVTSIGMYAFESCTSLFSVTIPASVTNIGDWAFASCTNLTGVYFKGNAPSVGIEVLYVDNNVTIHYLPGTTGWGTTFGDRPTALWRLPYPVILSFGPSFGAPVDAFGFRISWAANVSVVVEASTNLANALWLPVSTNALVNGWAYFSDPQWTNHPARFYRIRSL